MQTSPTARSVENLQQLYTVVIGLSLSLAISNVIYKTQGVISLNSHGWPIDFGRLLLFFTFLSLVIPVYHGAMRHLDISYIENGIKDSKSGSLILDFIILFIEGCFFLLLSELIPNTVGFLYVIVSLLIVDVIWACIAFFGFSTDVTERKAIKTWGILNFITIILIIFSFIYFDSLDSMVKPVELYIKVVLFILIFTRSLVDYILCWHLYYPSNEN